jgi:hypothetical protein
LLGKDFAMEGDQARIIINGQRIALRRSEVMRIDDKVQECKQVLLGNELASVGMFAYRAKIDEIIKNKLENGIEMKAEPPVNRRGNSRS